MTKNLKKSRTASVGDLVSLFYEEYFALYGDEELASLAAAATVNDILCEQEVGRSKMAPSLEEAA